MANAGDFINKAKQFISGHPDQARNALDKVEEMVDKQTGGKYSDQIHKGGDMVEGRLGIPGQQGSQPADPSVPAQPTDPSVPAQPTDPGTPAPNPAPGTGDPQEPGDPGGPLSPGGPQQPGEPGGPLDPTQPRGDVLPEGGPTQQGAGNADGPTPGDPNSGTHGGF